MEPASLFRRDAVGARARHPCRATLAASSPVVLSILLGFVPGRPTEPANVGRAPAAALARGAGGQQRPVVLEIVDPASGPPGSRLIITIRGSGFTPRSRISLGNGIRVDSTMPVAGEEIRLAVSIEPDAAPGPRDVVHSFRTDEAVAAAGRAVLPGGFRVEAPEPQRVRVPPVIRLPLREAERVLAEIGLAIGNVSEVPADSRAGVVIDQDPPPGAMVESGTRVGLRLSAGPPPTPGPPGGDAGDTRSWLLPLVTLIAALLVGGALALVHPRSIRRSRKASTRAESGPPPPPAGREPEIAARKSGKIPKPSRAAPLGTGPVESAGGPPPPAPPPAVPPPPAPAPTAQNPPVRFTAFHPKEAVPERWASLLVYIHVPDAESDVLADSRARLKERVEAYGTRAATATSTIARGAEIRVEPELPGFQFNPSHVDVLWLEDWHCADFRMRAMPGEAGYAPGTAVNGRVAFWVGPILVGEVPIWSFIGTGQEAPAVAEPAKTTGSPYRRIFPSYSHRDADIVNALKAAYHAIGDDFMQDIDTLRSGQLWNTALLTKIDEADVFQLFWSDEASRSRYVRQEYEHALARGIPNFIRPLYWQKPLPDVPDELSAIHFHYLDPSQVR